MNNPKYKYKKLFIVYIFTRGLLTILGVIFLVGIPWCCLDCFIEWRKYVAVEDAPVVEGLIIERKPIIYKGFIRGAEFTIKVEDEDVLVYAQAQRYLINTPEKVKFRYNGDPEREVYLFEIEENQFVAFIICLFGFCFLTLPVAFYSTRYIYVKIKNKIP